jgi:hypothetical protein
MVIYTSLDYYHGIVQQDVKYTQQSIKPISGKRVLNVSTSNDTLQLGRTLEVLGNNETAISQQLTVWHLMHSTSLYG